MTKQSLRKAPNKARVTRKYVTEQYINEKKQQKNEQNTTT